MPSNLTRQIDNLISRQTKETVTLGEVLESFSVHGHMFPILIFSMPFVLPIPIPGLSFIFGLIISLLGMAITFGFKPWLPQRFKDHELASGLEEDLFLVETDTSPIGAMLPSSLSATAVA